MPVWHTIFNPGEQENASIAGSLILLGAAANSVIFGLCGLLGARQLIRNNWKWLALPLALATYGAITAFCLFTPLAFCISTAYQQSGYRMTVFEFFVLSFIMVFCNFCFAFGRETNLLTL